MLTELKIIELKIIELIKEINKIIQYVIITIFLLILCLIILIEEAYHIF